VHGANRLASNSLLDALVFGARVGRDLAREVRELPPPKALVGRHDDRLVADSTDEDAHAEIRCEVRDLMWRDVGLVRTEDGLQQAIQGLIGIGRRLGPGSSETHNLLVVAGLVTQAAYGRRDSRGVHFRADHPSDPSRGHQSTG
jgi:L-aspartate oxidase